MIGVRRANDKRISIHAPARGATGVTTSQQMLESISIHAPARGATVVSLKFMPTTAISIHAPARGATNNGRLIGYVHDDFNPRSREGSDNISCTIKSCAINISIHAPARGATIKIRRLHMTIQFQSTLPRGERQYDFCQVYNQHNISIHAPARGATYD